MANESGQIDAPMTVGDRFRQFFGFEVKRQPIPDSQKSFTPEIKDDGAVVVAAGGAFGTYIDLDGTVRSEAELVAKYREMSLQPEIERAVNEITNEAIVVEEGKETVTLILDDLNVNPSLKEVFEAEFKNIIDILDFKNMAYEMFKRWYVEGRQYYHVIIDEKKPFEGIKELRYIDPRKIRKIREVVKVRDPATDAIIQKTKAEYYVYNESGMNYGSKVISNLGTTGVKIKPDSIIHVTSGLTDSNQTMGLSYLHSAIKPLNMLRSLEDSTIIYHLSRAPERRLFYIDVGNLPRIKAEQYVRDLMVRYKNKLSYDAATGEIRDDRKFMTFQEDYWLPRREGSKGTEIATLQGGTQLSQLLETVQYFQDKLYRSLQVPISRLNPDNMYTPGLATEINRDELNFSKFIDRLRNKFSQLFIKAMERQLILKGITTPEDWDIIKKYIRFRWSRDIYFAELIEREIFMNRMEALQIVDPMGPYVGKYYSSTWIKKKLLMQTDEEIVEMEQQMKLDLMNPMFNQVLVDEQPENRPPKKK